MTTRRLEGKAALVTGAASGIGKAPARLFLEEGASVGIADNNGPVAQETAGELCGLGPVHVVVGDVASAADGARMVDETSAAFGRLDVVVCAAGIPSRARIA